MGERPRHRFAAQAAATRGRRRDHPADRRLGVLHARLEQARIGERLALQPATTPPGARPTRRARRRRDRCTAARPRRRAGGPCRCAAARARVSVEGLRSGTRRCHGERSAHLRVRAHFSAALSQHAGDEPDADDREGDAHRERDQHLRETEVLALQHPRHQRVLRQRRHPQVPGRLAAEVEHVDQRQQRGRRG